MKSQTQHIGNYSNVFDYSPFGAPLDGRAVENIFHQEEFTTDTIEFYIINACNSSHFEVDNVFIAHEEDVVVESKNYVVSNSYRYGFNGQEKDDELKGNE